MVNFLPIPAVRVNTALSLNIPKQVDRTEIPEITLALVTGKENRTHKSEKNA